MKNRKLTILLFCTLLLLPAIAVKASGTKAGDSIYVAKEEVVSGNLTVAGNSIIIDGNISGDLMAVGQNIVVNGRVEGDVLAAGQTITINGEVGGNVRIAGNSLAINGLVSRNVNAFGSAIVLGENSRIGWDLLAMGASLDIRGQIDGSVSGQAAQIIIAGQIGQNVDLKLSRQSSNSSLIVSSEAKIAGNLNYTSEDQAQISAQANIAGEVSQNNWPAKENNRVWTWFWDRLLAIFSALVVGLAIIFLMRGANKKILSRLNDRPAWKLLSGLIIFAALPIIALVLAMTVIGLPLGLIILAKWLIAMYVARIFAALWLGTWILKQLKQKESATALPALIIGVVIAWLLFSLPLVGWIFSLLAILFGLGGIWSYAKNQFGNI